MKGKEYFEVYSKGYEAGGSYVYELFHFVKFPLIALGDLAFLGLGILIGSKII